MAEAADARQLEVVVASMPAGVDMTADLTLIKPALLYADHVRLFSPAATLLSGVATLGHAEGVERALAIQGILEALGQPGNEEIANAVSGLMVIDQLPRAERRRILGAKSKELKAHMQKLDEVWEELRGKVDKILIDAHVDELVPALEAGLVTIDPLVTPDNFDIDSMLDVFIERLGVSLSDGLTYPLFDDRIGDLVHAGTAEGMFVPSPDATDRGKQVGAAAELFNYLPAFPPATISEILDVRTDLAGPLTRFRAAMIDIAALIDAAPYGTEFRSEIEQVYREHIAPALQEIREAVESSRYLTELLGEAVKDIPKWLGGGFIALVTTPWTRLSEVAVATATAAGTAAEPAAKAAWERYVDRREIRGHQYYLLYETQRLLER